MLLSRKISIFLSSIILIGCNAEKIESPKFVEEIPEFKTENFFRVQVSDQLTSIVPSDFSLNPTFGEKVFFNGSNLFKEQYISIEEIFYPVHSKMLGQEKDSLFVDFAERKMQSFQATLRVDDGFTLESTSEVDKMSTIRYAGSGKNYGFPLMKHFSFRFYNTDSSYLIVSSWSVDSLEMNRISKIFELSLKKSRQ